MILKSFIFNNKNKILAITWQFFSLFAQKIRLNWCSDFGGRYKRDWNWAEKCGKKTHEMKSNWESLFSSQTRFLECHQPSQGIISLGGGTVDWALISRPRVPSWAVMAAYLLHIINSQSTVPPLSSPFNQAEKSWKSSDSNQIRWLNSLILLKANL